MNNQQMQEIARKYAGKHLSALRSIKLYCREQCCFGDMDSWKNCTLDSCFLFKYRLGVGNRKSKKKLDSTVQVSAEESDSAGGLK